MADSTPRRFTEAVAADAAQPDDTLSTSSSSSTSTLTSSLHDAPSTDYYSSMSQQQPQPQPQRRSSGPLPPIELKGYKFFDSLTGAEFVVRGMDYYPRPNVGPLNHNSLDLYTEAHRHIWERDIPFLQQLNVNAIRLYAVDPDQNHDAFMCALQHAGIYVIVALARDCPTCAVTRQSSPDCYPPELKLQGQRVIQAFAKYSNTLAFSAGNEVNHFTPVGAGGQWNAPCQKKFLRDMREYLSSCVAAAASSSSSSEIPGGGLRSIPIGLVSADDEREALALYYNCQDDPNDPYQRAEWYGLNAYVFCDGKAQTYDDALGFQLLDASFESYHYSIPVLLTEFGCLSETFPDVGDDYKSQRNFLQAQWLLDQGNTLRRHFAGGFVFEYSLERENANQPFPYFQTHGPQNYGIGYFAPDRCDDVNVTCTYHPTPSFYALQRAYHVDIANLTVQSEFEPEPNRQQASTCPSDYPPLNAFDWSKVDDTPNLQCPQVVPQPHSSMRHHDHEGGFHSFCFGSSSPSSSSSSSSPPYVWFWESWVATALLIVGIVGISALVLVAIWRRKNSWAGRAGGMDSPPTSTLVVRKPSSFHVTEVSSYNTMASSASDDDQYYSNDETTGLIPKNRN